MKTAIFCLACDKYEWIYKHFFRFFEKNATELNLNFFFFTETCESGNDKYKSIKLGNKPWNERMLAALDYMKDYNDVIYLQEDFLIKSIDYNSFFKILDFHVRKSYITKLGINHDFYCNKTGFDVGGMDCWIQNEDDIYLMSHQPVTVFNRVFLESTINDRTPDPSSHEINGSQIMREKGLTRSYCFGESFYPKNRSMIFEIEHSIRKGIVLEDARVLIG